MLCFQKEVVRLTQAFLSLSLFLHSAANDNDDDNNNNNDQSSDAVATSSSFLVALVTSFGAVLLV